jgi:probable F420-dependent oxidoreductase
MRVGVNLPQIGRLADPLAVRELAVAAEQAGYSGLWALDRLLAPVRPRTPYPASPDGVLPAGFATVLDPITALTLAAAVTDRIRVGTSVLVAPWYPPVVLARSLTTLDHVSGGRLDVGLGQGWSADEYEATAVPPRHLAARLDELLDVLDAVWGPDPVAHTGARVRIAPARIGLKPVQRPRPPLLLAGYTPAGLDRVARRADAWNPAALPVDALAPMWRAVRDLAGGHGRDPDTLELVVRANITLSDQDLGADRASYVGSVAQVADDLDATRAAGAHEVVLTLLGDTVASAAELLDVYAELVAAASLAPEPVPSGPVSA